MGNQNSNKEAPALSEYDVAVMDLKSARDKLKKHQKKCEQDANKFVENATKLAKQGNREGAGRMLRLKKYREKRIKDVEGQLDNINGMLDSLAQNALNNRVLSAIQSGTQEVKRLQEEFPVEKAEQLMEETAEALEQQKEIDAILSQSLTADDDADVDAELEEMARELLPNLPQAPTTIPEVSSQEPEPPSARRVMEAS